MRIRSCLCVLLLSLASIAPLAGQTHSEKLASDLGKKNIKTDAESLLRAAAGHQDLEVRLNAIALLGERKVTSARSLLARLLQDDNALAIRRSAAIALMKVGDERGSAAIKKFLEEAADLRDKIALGGFLADQRDASGYPALIEAAASENPANRRLAATYVPKFISLAPLQPDPTVTLLQLARDPDPAVRYEALTGFAAALRAGAPVEELRRVAEALLGSDPSSEVREAARLALANMSYWKDCHEKPLSLGCPEGNRKFIERCRKDPKGAGCEQIKDLTSPPHP